MYKPVIPTPDITIPLSVRSHNNTSLFPARTMDDDVLLSIRSLVCEPLHLKIAACNIFTVLPSCNIHTLSPHRLDSRLATRRIPTRGRRPSSRDLQHPSANRRTQSFTKISSMHQRLQEIFPQPNPSSSPRTLGPHIRDLL